MIRADKLFSVVKSESFFWGFIAGVAAIALVQWAVG